MVWVKIVHVSLAACVGFSLSLRGHTLELAWFLFAEPLHGIVPRYLAKLCWAWGLSV